MSIDEHTSLHSYYKLMDSCALLPNDFVVELIRKAHKGDTVARDRVIKHNLRLVVKLSLRSHSSIELEDRIQFGNLGLMHAVEKYDPDKLNPDNGMPYAFSTYATWWIKQSIDRESMNTQSTIRVPVHALKSYGKVRKVQAHLYKLGVHHPKFEDYEKFFNEDFSAHDVHTYDRIPYSYSENVPQNDEDGNELSLFDTMIDEDAHSVEDSIDLEFLRKRIGEHLHHLNDNQRTTLILRFGLDGETPRTLDETGQILCLTRERARQIQLEALKRLRTIFIIHNIHKESVL